MTSDQKILRELRELEKDVYWQAVEARDARFNGVFVYGVRSTGVYCKPSCPSRRPRREKVDFFHAREEAEAAGFRACLRCKPRETAAPDPRAELVLRVCRRIEELEGVAPSLEELGAESGVSPQSLQRTFKSLTGITPRQYAAALRLRLFKSRIKEGEGVTAAGSPRRNAAPEGASTRAAVDHRDRPGNFTPAGRPRAARRAAHPSRRPGARAGSPPPSAPGTSPR